MNLKRHTLTVEEAKKGGINSGKSRAARKTLREELLALLSKGNTQERMSAAMVDKALNGDVSAFNTIRDTIGEKPVDKVDMSANVSYEKAIKEIVDENEY